MVKTTQTKPKAPSRLAADARNMVGIGKPRMAPTFPLAADHYQPLPPARELTTLYEHITEGPGHRDSQHKHRGCMPNGALAHRHILILKPIDYIGLYLIVITASCIAVNMLYRIYY